ncbi:MAG: hypothetical protein DYH20_00770 [Gammaproteobacteria bacterium PRO9]|nr:hypothetical protein [Gammaproteobacteria bacterium PRO9]
MRSINLFVTVLLATVPLLVHAAADADWLKVGYHCENGQDLRVEFRENGSAVRISMGDKPAVKLIARPAREGFRYGGSVYEVRGNDNELTWQTGNKTPVKCISSDPAVASFAAVAEAAR